MLIIYHRFLYYFLIRVSHDSLILSLLIVFTNCLVIVSVSFNSNNSSITLTIVSIIDPCPKMLFSISISVNIALIASFSIIGHVILIGLHNVDPNIVSLTIIVYILFPMDIVPFI